MSAASVALSPGTPRLRMWLVWAAVTTVGWTIGWVGGLVVGYLLLGTAMVVIGISAGVGLLQWPFLPPSVRHAGWWAPASVAGMAAPLLLFTLSGGHPLALDLRWLSIVVVGGTCAGALQQRILRQSLAHSWWWVLASMAGWALGLLVFAALDAIWPRPDLQLAYLLLVTVPPGVVFGVITGGALVKGLAQPEQPLAAPAWAPARAGQPWAPRYQPGPAAIAPAWAPVPATRPATPWPPIWVRWLITAIVIVVVGPLLLALLFVITISLPPPPGQEQPMVLDHTPSVAWSPDGTLLASLSPYTLGGDRVQLWDVASGSVAATQPGTAGDVADVALSPDGQLLATTDGASVRLWDVAMGARAGTLTGVRVPQITASPGGAPQYGGPPPAERSVPQIAFSPDDTLLAARVPDNAVQLWEVASGAMRGMLRPAPGCGVQDFAFSPDGARLVIATGCGVTLWDVATGAEVRGLPGMGWAVAVAFSPDGRHVAAAERPGGLVLVWDVATGTATRSPKRHWSDVCGVAFSPDSKLLATASYDHVVRIWNVATGTEVRSLRGHTSEVCGVAFSPDGSQLASASFDGMVKLWDVATGAELRSISWLETQ
ncbi:MAG: WD40 repeat domain-containing protein [Chloroflexales bacterium]|nr:WD40 repeat domain-containing protein [Chloroflexales bacterium]